MPSQWETMLHCNVVSHWLGAYTKWSLNPDVVWHLSIWSLLIQVMAYFAPSHHLNLCWLIVNCTLPNKLQWNLYPNMKLFIQENAFENVVCKMKATLLRSQYVKNPISEPMMTVSAKFAGPRPQVGKRGGGLANKAFAGLAGLAKICEIYIAF